MSRGLHRLNGVETVEVFEDKEEVIVQLERDNRLSLKELHREIRSVGYDPGPSRVRVAGVLQLAAEGLEFKVSGTGERLALDFSENNSALRSQLTATDRVIVLEGDIPPPGDKPAALRVISFSENLSIPE